MAFIHVADGRPGQGRAGIAGITPVVLLGPFQILDDRAQEPGRLAARDHAVIERQRQWHDPVHGRHAAGRHHFVAHAPTPRMATVGGTTMGAA